jgi:hypothetical protein
MTLALVSSARARDAAAGGLATTTHGSCCWSCCCGHVRVYNCLSMYHIINQSAATHLVPLQCLQRAVHHWGLDQGGAGDVEPIGHLALSAFLPFRRLSCSRWKKLVRPTLLNRSMRSMG